MGWKIYRGMPVSSYTHVYKCTFPGGDLRSGYRKMRNVQDLLPAELLRLIPEFHWEGGQRAAALLAGSPVSRAGADGADGAAKPLQGPLPRSSLDTRSLFQDGQEGELLLFPSLEWLEWFVNRRSTNFSDNSRWRRLRGGAAASSKWEWGWRSWQRNPIDFNLPGCVLDGAGDLLTLPSPKDCWNIQIRRPGKQQGQKAKILLHEASLILTHKHICRNFHFFEQNKGLRCCCSFWMQIILEATIKIVFSFQYTAWDYNFYFYMTVYIPWIQMKKGYTFWRENRFHYSW